MLSNDIMQQSEVWVGVKEMEIHQREQDNLNVSENSGVLCLHCNRVNHGVHDNFLCECGWINDLTSIDQLPKTKAGGICQISYMPISEDDMEVLSMNEQNEEKDRIQSLFLDLATKNVMIESQVSKKMRYHFIVREQLLR